MNRLIGKWSSLINVLAVVFFAIFMLLDQAYLSYLSSMFIAFSFVPLVCTYAIYAKEERKLCGQISMIFAAMYATIICLVYFAQLTTVHQGNLSQELSTVIDFQQFGLFFSYDLLGYGLMALSTFFAGLTIVVESKQSKILKALLMIHGIFFISCFIMPLLGIFSPTMEGGKWIGVIVLEVWCLYFIPIGLLSNQYFSHQR